MKCLCYTLRGHKCKNTASPGSRYCYLHQKCTRKLPECVRAFLGNELKFVKFLSNGVYGQVYEISDGTHNYAMKVTTQITKNTRAEIEHTKQAAVLGVAPKIYKYGACNGYIYLIMEKMDYSLDTSYPYRARDIIAALELYKTLLDHNVLQNDLKGQNVMLRNGKVFLIDYGLTRRIYKNKYHHLKKAADKLVNSLFYEARDYGSVPLWLDDPDPNKYKLYDHINRAVDNWLSRVGSL